MKRTLERLLKEYADGWIVRWELYGQLVGTVRDHSVPEILAGLRNPELHEFREFVQDMAGITRDDEIGSTHGEPSFGVAEIRKFLDYFRTHPE